MRIYTTVTASDPCQMVRPGRTEHMGHRSSFLFFLFFTWVLVVLEVYPGSCGWRRQGIMDQVCRGCYHSHRYNLEFGHQWATSPPYDIAFRLPNPSGGSSELGP